MISARLAYDPLKDFAPVTIVCGFPFVLVVHPALPVKNVQELIAYAKAKPGQLNFGSPGNGSTTHLARWRKLAAVIGLKAGEGG